MSNGFSVLIPSIITGVGYIASAVFLSIALRQRPWGLRRLGFFFLMKNAKRGVLSLIGEDGYPYGLPINQWYCEEDGKIYFHGAKEGHKIDAIKACDKVSFC